MVDAECVRRAVVVQGGEFPIGNFLCANKASTYHFSLTHSVSLHKFTIATGRVQLLCIPSLPSA